MRFDVEQLPNEQLTTEYRGKKLTLKFDPDAYSPAAEKRIRADLSETEGSMYWARIILECVTEWNVTRGGEPVPLTVEGVSGLGIKLLSHLHKEILQSIFPPATPEPNSGSSF